MKLPNLGENWLPTIIVDTREQTPLPISYPRITATLQTGDYSIAGMEDSFTVERKSIPDLFGSLTSGRERFMRELQRMKAYHFARLLIIGSTQEIEQGSRRAKGINPKAIIHSLHAIEARGVPVVFSPSPASAAALVERWAFWAVREALRTSTEITKTNDY